MNFWEFAIARAERQEMDEHEAADALAKALDDEPPRKKAKDEGLSVAYFVEDSGSGPR